MCVCVYAIYTCLCANECACKCVSTYGGQKLCLPYLLFPSLFFDTVSRNQGFINSSRLDNELQIFQNPPVVLFTRLQEHLSHGHEGTHRNQAPTLCLETGTLTSLGHIRRRAWLTQEPGICLFLCVSLSGFLLCGFWVLNCVLVFELQAFYWLSSLATCGSVSQCVCVFIFIARPEAVWAQTEIWSGWGLISESKLKP